MRLHEPNALIAVAFCATMLFAEPTSASNFCVHNNAELGSALFAAQGNGTADTVKLARGTYALSSHLNFHTSAGGDGLSLYGGWDSACATRIADASNTVIDGNDVWSVFVTSGGSLTFEAIGFQRTPIVELMSSAIKIQRNRFTGSGGDDAVQFENSSGSVLLDNNLFDGKNVTIRRFDGTSGAPPLSWQVVNNTFANAVQGTAGSIFRNGYGLFATTPGDGTNLSLVLANNISWGNSNGGVYFDGDGSVLATHNQWQSVTNANGVPLANGSGGNSTANPQLDSALHPIVPGSPVINTATTTFPGGIGALDVTGGPRVIGSDPDRGAFESAANDAARITVTTAADSGDCTGPGDSSCSLRGALTAAAAAGAAQRIEFNIPGSCPRTISVNSALPQVVDFLTIDGYTQPGASPNTLDVGSDARLCIVLRGNYSNARGLLVNDANAIMIVQGLAFENFVAPALEADAGSYHAFYGNQFGGNLAIDVNDNQALLANARAIRVGNSASRVYVGGPDPAQRNVVDGASLYGIALTGSGGQSYVRNNYVGLAPNGITRAGNAVGAIVQSPDNEIVSNYIAASAEEGLRIEGASGNTVHGNTIGLPADSGGPDVGNAGPGIRLAHFVSGNSDPSGNTIGMAPSGVIDANIIAGNGINGYAGPDTGDGGISVEAGASNRITGNRLFANYGINIDLNHDGPTANDAADADNGPNGLQNFPLLLSLSHTGDVRKINGTLDVSASSVVIEFFGAPSCGAAGRGDAAQALSVGTRPILVFNPGVISFSREVPRGPGVDADAYCRISATATAFDTANPGNNKNTSELSACFVDDTIFAHSFDAQAGWSCAP